MSVIVCVTCHFTFVAVKIKTTLRITFTFTYLTLLVVLPLLPLLLTHLCAPSCPHFSSFFTCNRKL